MRPATLVQLHSPSHGTAASGITVLARAAVITLVLAPALRVGAALASLSFTLTLFAVATVVVSFVFFHHATLADEVDE